MTPDEPLVDFFSAQNKRGRRQSVVCRRNFETLDFYWSPIVLFTTILFHEKIVVAGIVSSQLSGRFAVTSLGQSFLMSLCGCLGMRGPTPLDAPVVMPGNCGFADGKEETPERKVLTYTLCDAKRPNFDFVTADNGNTYIATFRATLRGDVIGCDSKPIPKAVFDTFKVIKKWKYDIAYYIEVDTGGVDLTPYFRELDEATAIALDVVLQ